MSCMEQRFLEVRRNANSGKLFQIQNFIGGEFVDPEDKIFLNSYNPATGEVWAEIPDSTETDVTKAVKEAEDAFKTWSNLSPQKRSNYMLRVADVIETNLDDFAWAESRDQGKPVSLARTVDIPRAIYNFRFFATSILHNVRSPIGVAGLISPWNLPLYLLTFKIAPAIATGNTVLAKPSEFTSVTAWLLAYCFVEAGLPPGVVNIIFGTGPKAGQALVAHPQVPLISFTGSTVTGRRIAELGGALNKKISLEMGGKNACIVFQDADRKKAMPTIVRSCFANQGEICLCTSRLFVQDTIFDEFVKEFVDVTNSLIVGHPEDPKTNIGALVSREHYEKVKGYILLAKKLQTQHPSVKLLCGGDTSLRLPNDMHKGYYLPPSVVTGVEDKSPLMQEEIFGPLVCLLPFRSEEEVVHRANDTSFGLSASLYSNDLQKVHRVAQRLQVGTVWCNCWLVRELNMPFGGMKASGSGREGSKDSIEFFTEKKNIVVKLD